MKRLTAIILTALFLSACSSGLPPEPKSWKNDLSGIQEEQINSNQMIVDEINNNKDVWSK
ncbi:hypothetical protein A1D22_09230 [Pasteurellaceae bacterium LFhippo2]|nr:hypothetical protein [Pasteurellaceae bacterium LFhippo2]